MKEMAACGARLITLQRKKMKHANRVRSRLAGSDFLGANGSPSRSVSFGAGQNKVVVISAAMIDACVRRVQGAGCTVTNDVK